MKAGDFRRLFEEKPVLLRLIATVTRQWIDTTHEFVSASMPMWRTGAATSSSPTPATGLSASKAISPIRTMAVTRC
jgi:hypothetical protein